MFFLFLVKVSIFLRAYLSKFQERFFENCVIREERYIYIAVYTVIRHTSSERARALESCAGWTFLTDIRPDTFCQTWIRPTRPEKLLCFIFTQQQPWVEIIKIQEISIVYNQTKKLSIYILHIILKSNQ